VRGWALPILFACNGGGGDDDCPPGQEKIGIYCFDPLIDSGVEPDVDSGVHRDASSPEPDASPRDTGFVLPDAGGPPDARPTDASVVNPGEASRILIRGSAVLTMAGAEHAPGEVYAEDGVIACVGAVGTCTASAAGATIVDTFAIVLPGLVDAHNHLAYNWLPEWVSGQLWMDHQQWQAAQSYDDFVQPYTDNRGDRARFCAMEQWGELRSLLNGTTTALGIPQARTCVRWLVRNPELSTGYSGFAADLMRTNTLGTSQLDATSAADLIADMDAGMVTAYMIHLAEGLSPRAHAEFDELVMFALLRPETKIIHGTALTATDLQMVAAAGSPIIWSPSSNIALYGETLDVPAAVAAGVSLSLSADWTPSGTDDLLHEARFARLLVETRWPGTFSDRDYVDMITRLPAEHMAIDAFVGTLEVGKLADILVVTGDPSSPYTSVLEARPQNIRLVLLGGAPSFGEPAIMESMVPKPSYCEDVDTCGTRLRACWDDSPDGPVTTTSVAGTIQSFYAPGPWTLFDCE
jgi:cytosine/adenosine deaminase-related metal-dependent hydrolase